MKLLALLTLVKLLALGEVVSLATAEQCEDFDCTAAIAGGVQAGGVQQVSTHVLDRKRAVHDPYFLFFFINMY